VELQLVRCTCKKLLAKASGTSVIEIICPRCGKLIRARLEAGALVRIEIQGRRGAA